MERCPICDGEKCQGDHDWPECVRKLKADRAMLNLQISAWQEYAAFLGVEVGNLSLFAAVHGWKCPPETVAKGSELRRKLGVNDDWTLIEKRICKACGESPCMCAANAHHAMTGD